MAQSLCEQVAVDKSSPDEFVSRFNPGRMGNAANIAYGGCAIGISIQAACQTTAPEYHLYTVMGNYLGPALTDRKLLCSVRRLRDTRTFATRQVEISQVLDDGTRRVCMVVLADFHVREKASMYEYSAPPRRKYAPLEECPDIKELVAETVRKGRAPPEAADMFAVLYGMNDRFMETRLSPEGVATQNMSGLVKGLVTDQDHLPITSKTSAHWTRVRHPMDQPRDKFAALGFIMDEGLSFLPLTHTNKAIHEAAACSSLDFALRFFTEDFDLGQWNFREWNTVVGSGGRTYTEARIWDSKGNMVANMTQQSIMRPRPGDIKASL